jgi:hypothetical protein
MRRPSILAYSIPASLLLFCWMTAGVSATYDHDVVTAFGFPLIWYTPSMISSGGYEISIGCLIADLVTYGLVTHLIITALMTRVHAEPGRGLILKVLLSLGAVLSVFISITAFSIDPHLTWWELRPTAPADAPKNYFVAVGLQPQRARIADK